MAYFPKCSTFFNLQKALNFKKFEQNADVKIRGNFQYFGSFLSILRLARMFYIIYIKKIFDWSKNEQIKITFLQVGKLRVHKLCQNKHFSTAGTISPNSKRKTFFCSLTIIFSTINLACPNNF